MKQIDRKIYSYIEVLMNRYSELKICEKDIVETYLILEKCYENCGKLLIAGNGGSAADAEHIVAELMKSFKRPRPIPEKLARRLEELDPEKSISLVENLECSLPAISLVSQTSLMTAYINDVDGEDLFAQQLLGYAKEGDVLLAITTSGNSKNILKAAILARALGIKIVCLTGKDGGDITEFADISIRVPEKETYKIQELHLPVYHCLCMMLEEHFFANDKKV